MVFPWPTPICAHAHIINFLEKKKKKIYKPDLCKYFQRSCCGPIGSNRKQVLPGW